MIQVHDLKKSFGTVRALDGVSFTVEKGEIVGFLGPNAAGKTTTMRIIAGYLTAGQGDVLVDGVSVEDEPVALKAKIGYLPENPPLYPEMRVREYLAFVARLKGVAKEEVDGAVRDAMQAVQIEGRADSIIANLSKGFKQRVGLAGALVHKPQVLILDEPTVGLDPNQIIEIRKLIRGLKDANRTVILSTHILPEVDATCDRVIIINKGQIAAIGTKEELLRDAAHAGVIEVETARDAAAAAAAVERVPGVTGVARDGQRLAVTASVGAATREAIARAVVESGAGLVELHAKQAGLEDIFVKLTQSDAAAAASGAESQGVN